jgi:hypothetical protein
MWQWSFSYPLFNATEDPRQMLQEDNVQTKTYAFALAAGQNHQTIHVQEVLTEVYRKPCSCVCVCVCVCSVANMC